MLTTKDMAARVERLAALIQALAKESERVRTATECPLLPLDRRRYRLAIQEAVAGLDAARLVLVEALPIGDTMKDGAGLLRGVLDSPDDDSPR